MATEKQTVKLYNNKITLHFNPDSRNRYTIEETGKSPVGVTTILNSLAKPGLALWPMYEALKYIRTKAERWERVSDPKEFDYTVTEELLLEAEKAHTLRSDKGKDIGSIVHEAIEKFLGEESVDIPANEAGKAFRVFVKWFSDNKPKVLLAEQIGYSKEHDYAGTCDLVCEIDGKTVIVDVKTSNVSRTAPLGIYTENFLQLGAYSLMLREMGFAKPDDLMVINAGKDGKLNTLSASELGLKVDYCEDSFLAVLGAYRFITPLSKQVKEM